MLIRSQNVTFEESQCRVATWPVFLKQPTPNNSAYFQPAASIKDTPLAWRKTGDWISGAQIAGMVFSETFIKERTDVARRWSVGYVRGLRDYNEFLNGKNRDAIAPILAEFTGLAPEVIDQVGWAPLDPDGRLNVESLMQVQRQLLEWGTIQQVLPVE